jgi:hypothetical protein
MVQHDTILNTTNSSVLLTIEQKSLVANVADQLQEAVSLATNDFFVVAAFIKNLRDRSKLIHSDNFGKEVSNIVTELQYIDALKQRIDHVIFFLEEIKELKQPGQVHSNEVIMNCRKTCGLIFQLSFYQLKVAKADFVKSVEKIKSALTALKALSDAGLEFDVEPKVIFTYFNQVIKNLQDVAHSLIHLSTLFPVNTEVRSLSIVRLLLNRYTMESEREVLRWCLNYVEDNSIGELKIDDLKEDQIQLF